MIFISDFQHSQLVLGDCFKLITYVSVLQWPNQWIFLLLHCTKIYGWNNWGEKHCLTCIHLLTHISPQDSWILNSWIKGAANWYFVIYHIKIIYNIILSTFLYTHSYSYILPPLFTPVEFWVSFDTLQCKSRLVSTWGSKTIDLNILLKLRWSYGDYWAGFTLTEVFAVVAGLILQKNTVAGKLVTICHCRSNGTHDSQD